MGRSARPIGRRVGARLSRERASPAAWEPLEPRILLNGTPEFEAGVKLQDGGSTLSPGYMSAPDVVDWNNDGKKDLIAGRFTYGYVTAYLNQGTDASPSFNGGSQIESGGSPITTSYG